MKDKMTCIRCPKGCRLEVEWTEDRLISVTGNQCSKGAEYAECEIFNPTRIVTTTVSIIGGQIPLVPVKTNRPVAKNKTKVVVKAASALRVVAPIQCGEVIVSNICETGADLVATRPIYRQTIHDE